MLLRYLAKHNLRCIIFLLMMVGSTIAYSWLVLNVSPLFDALTVGDIDTVLPLFALMLFGLLAIRIVDYWADALSISTVNLIREQMKNDLFKGEMEWIDMETLLRDSGEYTADFTNDITMMEAMGFRAVKELATHSVSIITFGFALYTIERSMIIPVLISLLICIILPVLTKKSTAGKMNLFLQRFDVFIQKLDDYFSGFALLKNYGISEKIEKEFEKENLETEHMKLRAEIRIETINALITGVSWIMRILVVVLGFEAALQGRLNVGAVIAAYTLATSLSSPIESIVRNFNEISSIHGIEQKIDDALKKRNTLLAYEKSGISSTCPDIFVEHVSVNLDNNTILSDINLHFEAEKRYLIIGNNGSGKSTLMQAIKGIVPVASGRICIGDRVYDGLHQAESCNLISYSNEKVSLFSDTVENNLTFYGVAEKSRLRRAIEQVKLNVPLEHEIGDAGKRISSGEKRRLEIARSLYHKEPVLIFDEVISTLDVETAYEIEKLILSLRNHTVIMVSNAFSGLLLQEYDQIILMDSGTIIAQGTHDMLLTHSQAYRSLYEVRCGRVSEGDF